MNDDVLAAFLTARHHLNPGGIFLFDVWYGPAVLTDRPSVRIKWMAHEEIEILGKPIENLQIRYNQEIFAVQGHCSGSVIS